MARPAGCGRRKFLDTDRGGGNFLCAGSRTVLGERRGISYGPLSRSSGAGELHQPGKCRGFLGFLRTGFFHERPVTRERDAQRRALSGAKRARAATSRAAAGYPKHGNEWKIYFQHTISPELFLSFSQDRGYREGYLRADLAGHRGHHDWKTGVDGIFTPVHEALQYSITKPG